MIQSNDTNRVMDKKKTVGIFLRPEIIEVYESLTKELKGNEKWLVANAAFLALLRLPERERMNLYGQIKSEDLPGRNLRDLIAEARDVGAGNSEIMLVTTPAIPATRMPPPEWMEEEIRRQKDASTPPLVSLADSGRPEEGCGTENTHSPEPEDHEEELPLAPTRTKGLADEPSRHGAGAKPPRKRSTGKRR